LLYWIVFYWTDLKLTDDKLQVLAAIPVWVRFELGTDDMPDAYNGSPVKPSQAGANIVAVYNVDMNRWEYSEQDGMGFGLMSAVTNFCRLPTLAVACARTVFATITGSYFDDLPTIDIAGSRESGQSCTQASLEAVGAAMSLEKRYHIAPYRVFLGTAGNLSHVHDNGMLTRKPGKINRVGSIVQQTLSALVTSWPLTTHSWRFRVKDRRK
jgi:hypothetical protein